MKKVSTSLEGALSRNSCMQRMRAANPAKQDKVKAKKQQLLCYSAMEQGWVLSCRLREKYLGKRREKNSSYCPDSERFKGERSLFRIPEN